MDQLDPHSIADLIVDLVMAARNGDHHAEAATATALADAYGRLLGELAARYHDASGVIH